MVHTVCRIVFDKRKTPPHYKDRLERCIVDCNSDELLMKKSNIIILPVIEKSLNKTLNKNQTKKLNKLKVDSSVSGTLTEAIGRGGSSSEYLTMLKKNQELTGHIRRLTPVECERLQGFPDN